MGSFAPDRALLNPHFEAYKLINDDDDADVERSPPPQQVPHALPGPAFDLADLYSPATARAPALGFKEVQDRMRHAHFVPGTDGNAAYVDRNRFMVLIVFDQDFRPSYHPLYRLRSPPASLPSPALPSLVSLDAFTWLVADGSGRLTVLRTRPVYSDTGSIRWTAQEVRHFELPQSSSTIVQSQGSSEMGVGVSQRTESSGAVKPFKLVAGELCDQVSGISSERQAIALLQSTRRIGHRSRVHPGIGLPVSSGGSDPSASIHVAQHTVFDLELVALPIPTENLSAESKKESGGETKAYALAPIWSVTGDDSPYYVKLDPYRRRHLLAAETGFVAPGIDTPSRGVASASSSERKPDRAARRGRQPPYSWAQTSDTVTLVFTLPATTSKAAIRVHFSPVGISLSLADHESVAPRVIELPPEGGDMEADSDLSHDEEPDAVQQTAAALCEGKYASRPLWAEIDPSGSVWTWERSGGGPKSSEIGLLTLHLEKRHAGTRWSQVFEQRRAQHDVREQAVHEQLDEEEDDKDEDVPETIDPSELLNMIEGLEKYTAQSDDVPATDSGSAVGRAGAAPSSLLRDGLEEEDSEVGRPLALTWIEEPESFVKSSSESSSGIRAIHDPAAQSSTLLALPLQYRDLQSSAVRCASTSGSAIVVRYELDGLVFTPPSLEEHENGITAVPRWSHKDTLPALSFVLASKRDAGHVYVHHRAPSNGPSETPRSVVLTFEAAPGAAAVAARTGTEDFASAGAGNLFVYYGPSAIPSDKHDGAARQGKAIHGQSRVLRLGSGADGGASEGSGALLGAIAVSIAGRDAKDSEPPKGEALVCLCERQLIVLRHVL